MRGNFVPLCDSFDALCGAIDQIRVNHINRQILGHILLHIFGILSGDDPLMMIDDDLILLMMI